MAAPCTTEYFIGQGKVYIATRTPGSSGAVNGGWVELGDSDKLSITTKQTFTDVYESCTGTRSRVVHVPVQADWTFEVDTLSFSKENLARGLYGDSAQVSGSSVTGEALTAYALNQMVPLAHPGVSSVVVKDGVTTLTAGTDYVLDAVNGTITLISATNLTGPAPYTITADYTYAAHEQIKGNMNLMQDYSFRFQGISMTTQKPVIVTVHRVALDLTAAFDLISTNINKTVLMGSVLPDASQPAGDSQYVTIVKATA